MFSNIKKCLSEFMEIFKFLRYNYTIQFNECWRSTSLSLIHTDNRKCKRFARNWVIQAYGSLSFHHKSFIMRWMINRISNAIVFRDAFMQIIRVVKLVNIIRSSKDRIIMILFSQLIARTSAIYVEKSSPKKQVKKC